MEAQGWRVRSAAEVAVVTDAKTNTTRQTGPTIKTATGGRRGGSRSDHGVLGMISAAPPLDRRTPYDRPEPCAAACGVEVWEYIHGLRQRRTRLCSDCFERDNGLTR